MEQIQSEIDLIKARFKDIENKSTIQDKRIKKIQQRIEEISTRLGFLENNTGCL